MRFRQDESGQVLVLTALCMAVLLGFLALAVDVGVLFRAKRNMQIAADAAAVAGALAYAYGPGTAASAAQTAAGNNGVTNFTAGHFYVSTSPADGYHQGAGFVEVVIDQPVPTFFMNVFNINSVTVGARAVAGTIPNPACLIALDPSAKGSFDVQGAAQVNTPNCGIHINSNATSALCSTGQATINAPFIGIAGYQNRAGKCNGTQPNVSTDNGTVKDPFANLPWPDTTCTGSNAWTSSATTITQAVANALPSKSVTNGSTTANVTCFSGSNVAIQAGVTLGSAPVSYTAPDGTTTYIGGNNIFVFENGVTFAGSATISGTMDLQGGGYSATNNQVSMYAPANTGYTYNSLALMVDPLNTAVSCDPSIKPITAACLQVQFGSGSGNIDGIIYAPNATVYMQDHGGTTTVAGIVADAIYDKASILDVYENYNLAHPSTTPLSTMAMVE